MPYLEVDVLAGANAPYELHRMFSLLRDPVPVTHLWGTMPSGEDAWLAVTGWSAQGPCPAYAAMAEDSGDGVALLVYGGDQGIRLRPKGAAGPWDLSSPDQWGEPCLLLAAETQVREAGRLV